MRKSQSPFTAGPAVRPKVDADMSFLRQMVVRAHAEPLLRAFGAPAPEHVDYPARASLSALHLATAFHRVAVVLDVLQFYCARGQLSASESDPLEMLIEALKGEEPRAAAESLYRQALAFCPQSAEAHYGLARLLRASATSAEILEGFAASLNFPPHPEAPAHAYLHANAHWERAIIFEDLGSSAQALSEYRAALAMLDNFGVHHLRVARFFRRLGLAEEATEHFRRCMTYSHRYFAEFILPPLDPAKVPVAPAIEVVHTNRRGEQVVYWQGAYFAVPQGRGGVTPKDLDDAAAHVPRLPKGFLAMVRRLVEPVPPKIRHATSVAALEDLP